MTQEPEVFTITGAATGITEDQKGRQRRYLFSMGLRTVCFVSSIFAHGALRWILIGGAVFLPYFSVVIANAGRERGAWKGTNPYVPPAKESIAPAPHSDR